jgi:myo-inositol-1(or 4)-monophosphatase
MLDELIPPLLEAGRRFEQGFHAAKTVRHKGTVDLVTQYDEQIDAFLSDALAERFANYTVVGEEGPRADLRPERAIYLDPIDGTTNFVHQIPFCAISVGIWEKNRPVAAAVYNPILNELFTAEAGAGARLNGRPIAVSRTRSLQRSLVATGFPYTKTERGQDYEWVMQTMARMLPETQDIRRLGSAAIDLCYVAAGIYDAFYECNLKPWDVAAGLLIVQEAGGRICTHTGAPYRLDDPVIVATNGHNHEAVLSRLAPYGEADANA